MNTILILLAIPTAVVIAIFVLPWVFLALTYTVSVAVLIVTMLLAPFAQLWRGR